MNSDITKSVSSFLNYFNNLKTELFVAENQRDEAQRQMEVINVEKSLLERSTLAIQQVKPLLSAASIKQCEELANSCIEAVFQKPYTVEYSVEDGRFKLNKGDFQVDLAASEGGGIAAVISFVFQIYLIIKLKKRKFICFDEAFTQISDLYIDRFIDFVMKMCDDLGLDILLITHDQRVTECHHDYIITNGEAKKIL